MSKPAGLAGAGLGATHAEVPVSRPDLRLGLVAVGMYAAQWAVMRWTTTSEWLVGGLLISGLAAWSLLLPEVVRRVGASAAALALLGLGLGTAVGAVATAAGHPRALLGLAADHAVVTGTLRLTGDPRSVPALRRGGAATWSVKGRLSEVVGRGQAQTGVVNALVRGGALAQLRYGEVARVAGRLAPGWPGSTQVVTLNLARVEGVRPANRVDRSTARVRTAFRAAAARLPPDSAGLLVGLAVGDESLLPADLGNAMRDSGLAHLTAVSGSNTSLVVLLAIAVANRFGVRWQARIALGGAALACYVCLVRPQPSVLRAAAMGVIALLALTRGGRRGGIGALAGAVIVLLAVLPELAQSMGFGLSVAATAGLLTCSGRVADWLAASRLGHWLPRPVVLAIAVSFAAQLATLPLAGAMGNGLSLVALPANLLAAPVVPYITVVGLVGALLAVPLAPAAGVAATLAGPPAGYLAWVARRAALAPSLPWPAGLAGGMALAALLALLFGARELIRRGLAHPPRGAQWLAVWVFGVMLVAAIRAYPRWVPDGWPPAGWVLVSCDVGQGDATVVRIGAAPDTALLVDVGPEPSAIRRCLRDLGVHRLAAVLLTHFHADHIDGLPGVMSRTEVGSAFTTPVRDPPAGAAQVARQLSGAGLVGQTLQAGQRLVIGPVGVDVLWPARVPGESIPNNSSLVLELDLGAGVGNTRVLLTGDIEPLVQGSLLGGPGARAQIVKVPHHGSAGQQPGFARWTGARIALISVGEGNDYGHPADSTVKEYEGLGALVARTDQHGDIAVVFTAGRGLALAPRR